MMSLGIKGIYYTWKSRYFTGIFVRNTFIYIMCNNIQVLMVYVIEFDQFLMLGFIQSSPTYLWKTKY